jgi:hypothetical protein
MDSQRSPSFGGVPFAQRRTSQEYPASPVESFAPMYGSPGAVSGYQPTPPQTSYMPLAPVEEDLTAQSPAEVAPPIQAAPAVNGLFYQPHGQQGQPQLESEQTSAAQSPYYQGPPGMPQPEPSSYMPPPSNAYAPPSYAAPDLNSAPETTDQPSAVDEEPQPRKKKSFMDDDDDDDLAARASAMQKAENDRKADEAFRKAAEEDGKSKIGHDQVQVFQNSTNLCNYSQERCPAIPEEGLVRWLVWRCQEGSRKDRRRSYQGQAWRREFLLLR